MLIGLHDADEAVARIDAIRRINPKATVYAQAEVNPGIEPKKWQKIFAQKYIYSGAWRKTEWYEWVQDNLLYWGRDVNAGIVSR